MAFGTRRSARRSSDLVRSNTAPMWKKATIVLSAAIAAALVVSVLNASHVSFWELLASVIVVAGGVVWGVSRLLGVHVGLRSWD